MTNKRSFYVMSVFFLLIISSLTVNHASAQETLTVWVAVDTQYQEPIITLLTNEVTKTSINIVEIPYNKLSNYMLNAKINGSLPDAVVTESDIIPVLANQGSIKPLTDKRDATLYPGIERTASYYKFDENGNVISNTYEFYGKPIVSKTVVLYMNTLRWSEDITTMDELYNAALKSNDQTIPVDPKYGFVFTDLPDPALALFYGKGGQIFKDNKVDATHIQILEPQQIEALKLLYDMAVLRKLTPAWEDQGTENARNIFANQGIAALMIDNSLAMAVFKNSTVFGGNNITRLKAFPVPGNGAPLRSIVISPTASASKTAMNLINDLISELHQTSVQEKLFPTYSLLPVKQDILKDSDDVVEKAFHDALLNGRQMPISTRWRQVEKSFSTNVESLLKGYTDYNETALSIDLALRVQLPRTTELEPIPVFSQYVPTNDVDTVTDTKGGFLTTTEIFILGVIYLITSSGVIIRRRR